MLPVNDEGMGVPEATATWLRPGVTGADSQAGELR